MQQCSLQSCSCEAVRYYDFQTSSPHTCSAFSLEQTGASSFRDQSCNVLQLFCMLDVGNRRSSVFAVVQLCGITAFGIHPRNSLLSSSNKQGRVHLCLNDVKSFNDCAFLTSTTDAAVLSAVVNCEVFRPSDLIPQRPAF